MSYPSDAKRTAYLPIMARDEAAETADREQNGEGDREDDDGRGCGAAGVTALDPAEHVDGHDLRLERQVAGDEHDRSELTDRTCERQRDTGEDRRQDVRQDHAAEGRETRGAERRGGVFHLRVELEQHRLDRAHDERKRDEE